MKCLRCGYIVPDDSEFCPYCGSRVEKVAPVAEVVRNSPAQAMDTGLTVDSKEERDRITQSQRYFDPDYGYSPENPIVTSSIPMIGYYLTALRTLDGKPFTWERMARQDNSQIDSYCLYLDGIPYKGIYFTATGNDTEYVPVGLFKDADAFEAAKQGIALEELLERREDAKRKAEQKRANRKKAIKVSLFSLLLLALVAGGYFSYVYGYPYLRYQLAVKNIQSTPQESIEIFKSFGNYRDSVELCKWAHYYRMKQLGEQGDYAGAIAEAEFFMPSNSVGVLQDYISNSGETLLNSRAAMIDSWEQLKAYHLKYAGELVKKEKYTAAIDELNKIASEKSEISGEIDDLLAECYYNLIIQSYGSGKWGAAYESLMKFASTGKGKDKFDVSEYQYDIFYNYTEELIKENTVISLERAMGLAIALIRDYGESDVLKDLQERAIDCYKQAQYDGAISAMNRGAYRDAVRAFVDLEDYKDSKSQMLEAMYQYVHTNEPPTRTGSITTLLANPYFSYAKTLSEKNYKDSRQFYKELTEWNVYIRMNDDPDDHFKDCNSVSKYAECCVHVLAMGGAPGETVNLRYVFTMSNGGSVSGKWDWGLGNLEWTSAWCYYEQPQYAPTGTCKVRIYNVDTGKLMAEDSIRITG